MTGTGGTGGRVVGGRYRLERPLGRGGMGTVWLAVDEVLRREVAVKEVLLPPDLDDDERRTRCERAMREALATARVQHPNVVTVFDVVEDEDRPWIVMELLRARSLAEALEEGRLGPEEAADVGLKVLAALRAARAADVLHRDVKPSNILIAESGRVVLTDFGIATVTGTSTLTATGMLVGSPEYLAPERVLGRRPGPASDLWSLGVTLYEAVEGISPFRRTGAIETLTAVLQDQPAPPRHAGALAPVLDALLRKEPLERPDEDGLERLLRDVVRPGGPASPPPVPPPGSGQGTTLDAPGRGAGPYAAGGVAGFAAGAAAADAANTPAGAWQGPGDGAGLAGAAASGDPGGWATAANAAAAGGPRSPYPGQDALGTQPVGGPPSPYGSTPPPGGLGGGTDPDGGRNRRRTLAVVGSVAAIGAVALTLFVVVPGIADEGKEPSGSSSTTPPATGTPTGTETGSTEPAPSGTPTPTWTDDDDSGGAPTYHSPTPTRPWTSAPPSSTWSPTTTTSPTATSGGGLTPRPSLIIPRATLRAT